MVALFWDSNTNHKLNRFLYFQFHGFFFQEYINTVRIGHRIHAGVTLATECIQSFSMGGMTNTGPNARRRNVQVHSCPKTICFLCQTRANEICFMIASLDIFLRQIVYTIHSFQFRYVYVLTEYFEISNWTLLALVATLC